MWTATGRKRQTTLQPASNDETTVSESASSEPERSNVRPNPSLSPRPTTAGVVSPAPAVRSIIGHRAYATCLRGFDPNKDRLNLEKHGLSLSLAEGLDWEAALLWIDDRQDYGEMRVLALAPKTEILYYVAFVDRADVRRIISLRRANRREVKRYVQALEEADDQDA